MALKLEESVRGVGPWLVRCTNVARDATNSQQDVLLYDLSSPAQYGVASVRRAVGFPATVYHLVDGAPRAA
eukprot:scaffold161544_cov35-Tisochrysis_lutea.AAC.2